ncbi:MAG TPA: dTDP-4-dehydrorhamnose 3,5-epimerase family protein [Burkholderiales bacterium]|nr:dTDP-4-dehydrorhamnose 3,5-epimerase family protein [Burkholderiales bacterium]
MTIHRTPIAGVHVVEGDASVDHRGSFARLFCGKELAGIIGERHIVQINHSRTRRPGAVRGMHYQRAPDAELKMVRCLSGAVWDVAVDLRAGSPTFLEWHAEELTSENGRMLVLPEGCAHGFQVLREDSALLYLHTSFYNPEAEGGVRYDDPRIGIAWPLAVSDVSVRDRGHPLLPADFAGLAG